MELLKQMCAIHAPSGNESAMTQFVLNYIKQTQSTWKVRPELYYGEDYHDCIIVKMGTPRTAIFAHLDSIGFTVRYGKELVKIGGPASIDGMALIGEDSQGKVETELVVLEDEYENQRLEYLLQRELERGTELTFKPNWREDAESVQCCYMDNRLGVWNALKVAETMENGLICFSTYEEHKGGTAGMLARIIYEKWNVKQALISDITWITSGVQAGKGVVISMRDSGIPRRSYLNKIIAFAKASNIPFQLEVEATGGSDGNQIQASAYPIDWLFIGAAEENVHTPDEKVNKKDIQAMVDLYTYLMREL